MNRLKSLELAEPAQHYERAAPGDTIHIDIDNPGRFTKIGYSITGGRCTAKVVYGVNLTIASSLS